MPLRTLNSQLLTNRKEEKNAKLLYFDNKGI